MAKKHLASQITEFSPTIITSYTTLHYLASLLSFPIRLKKSHGKAHEVRSLMAELTKFHAKETFSFIDYRISTHHYYILHHTSLLSFPVRLKKSHGKCHEVSWQISRSLMAKLKNSHGKAQEVSWQSSRSLMAKLTKSHGKAHEVSWQSSRSLMAKLTKSHGKAHEVSWQSSRSLMAKLTKSHGKAQEVSWQSSRSLMAKLKKSHGKADLRKLIFLKR
ncbi:hypothetical protein VNO80_06209 [Phaseolus coccineus]|uniref:Uncharacterized protein n=1 Tax=Phaseolus coccineus TaxID=3886 RepID=A0AAN9NHN7_PHACN